MDRFVVSVTSGLSLGGIFMLISLGIVLAYRATGTFNFAQGQLVTFASFMVAGWAAKMGVGVALIAALLFPALVAAAFYYIVLRRLTGGASHFTAVIATLGLGSILEGVLVLLFGGSLYDFDLPGMPEGTVSVLGVNVDVRNLLICAAGVVVAVAVAVALRFSRFGRSLLASGQNPLLASQGGINIGIVQFTAWGFAGLLAGFGGVAYASTHAVDPSMLTLAFAAFPAILIGGMDSMIGAAVGSILIGLFQGFVITYSGAQYVDLVTYGLLLVVLLVRPQGLFGTKRVIRV
ncbi:MAG: hypothetical protein ABS81_09650 [Pseudonocardia sp. SCN 72-86]|nr:MAG: hypothetical protein ABS81_09650 [Pseudonocardia sp. SCN 72-86]